MSPDCHAAAAARSVCGQEMRPDKSRRPGQEPKKKKKKEKNKGHHYRDVVVIERRAKATGESWGLGGKGMMTRGQPKEEEG